MNVVLTIIVGVLIFGVVVFFHELGHFFVAKKSGIKVNEFAVGMGPVIFKKKKGETTYALRLLPIGGFVSLAGEDEEEENLAANSYLKAPIWKRFLTIIAGAFMNFVLGFLAIVLLQASDAEAIRSTKVANFAENASTQATGLQIGDEILNINGRRCFTINDLSYEFMRLPNESVTLTVRREGKKIELENVKFTIVTEIDAASGEEVRYMQPDFSVQPVQRNFFTVIKESFHNTISYARLVYFSLFDLIAGRVPLNSLSGPVGIVSSIGVAMKHGWRPVVDFMALISVNLGVMNMLPLPALDGGKALLLIIEGIRKKPIKQKYEAAINIAGFALLMCLMVFVSVNDIRKLFM